jgi:ABC-type transport system involved in multi-copper enzyme maturation permease subunit
MTPRIAGATSGLTAIGVKELRGRMRGKRAFIAVTVYLVLLGGFAWMVDIIAEQAFRSNFGGQVAYASAAIGKSVFTALLFLETLLVTVLAPAYTAGAISTEREKQTLDLLTATPISSRAIVMGKLLSALSYVFVLVLASIPLSALVFMFGGVAPDDVLRGYVVLIATAIGLGSLALFFSAIVKRTQAATVLSYVTVLGLTLGCGFIFIFWSAFSTPGGRFNRDIGRPPEALLYLNPFVAQVDVLCGAEGQEGGFCGFIGSVTGRPTGAFDTSSGGVPRGANPRFNSTSDVDTASSDALFESGPIRDTYWPRSVLAWLLVAALFTGLSVRFVRPSGQRRGGGRGFLRRRAKGGSP